MRRSMLLAGFRVVALSMLFLALPGLAEEPSPATEAIVPLELIPTGRYTIPLEQDHLVIAAAEGDEPAAYIRNKSVTAWARFTVSPSDITSAKIQATSAQFLGNLAEQTAAFANGTSSPEYVRFTAGSATGNTVRKEDVTWAWQYRDVNGTGSQNLDVSVGSKRISGPHTVYVVLDRAKDPWKTWGHTRPWTEVFAYACVWAADKSDEDDNPYSDAGTLASWDHPTLGAGNSSGAVGDTIEFRVQFGEFARLEIGTTWHRVSDFYLWRIHFNIRRVAGAWQNDNTTKELSNAGW